jgi:hypothetical protein
MIQDQLRELEQCLLEFHNPVLKYLEEGTPFDPDHFANMLYLLQLEASEDLNALYTWKPGLKKEIIGTLGFNFHLFDMGSHIEYTEALREYQVLVLREEELFSNRFLPFVLMPGLGLEAPILIDLSKKSKTFGQIFYDSPATGVTEPTSIFDSLGSMIETVIACYREGVYNISNEGVLDTDNERILTVSSRINKNSDYWKDW